MKILKGDTVKVITGKNAGTVADVIAVYPKTNKVVVEGVNMKVKNIKPTQANPDGGRIEREVAIDVSNVMAYDSKAKVASRIGYVVENGTKVRVYKKTGNKVKGGKK